MKGKIDEYGCLQIERAGDWIPCGCRPGGIMPHDNDYGTCDHSCPHFGEPEAEMNIEGTVRNYKVSVNSADDVTPLFEAMPETNVCMSWRADNGECEKLEMKLSFSVPGTPTGRTRLRLCHGTVLVFDEFTDERSAT